MKKLIAGLLMMAGVVCANNMAILARVGLDCEVVRNSIIGECYLRGPSGAVYVFGYCSHWAGYPDSETHLNIDASDLTAELIAVIPTLNKSICIHSVTDPDALMAAVGMVRCDKDGNDLDLNAP